MAQLLDSINSALKGHPAVVLVDGDTGMGKTIAHNLQLLESLGALHGLGCPILLGVSRKRFIGRLEAATG